MAFGHPWHRASGSTLAGNQGPGREPGQGPGPSPARCGRSRGKFRGQLGMAVVWGLRSPYREPAHYGPVPPRCPRTAINSQRSPLAATCEH